MTAAVSERLTDKQIRLLQTAAAHFAGLLERPYLTGLERVSWDRNATKLSGLGYLKPYAHGGFEITQAGYSALKRLKEKKECW